MKPLGNYIEELYGPGEYKLTWMLCYYFFCIAYLFYKCQTCIFCFLIIELCFSKNRTDDRSFLSIRSYGASRELHRGALWPG
jgi:hypothetical protein